jgi:hypothetical protein
MDLKYFWFAISELFPNFNKPCAWHNKRRGKIRNGRRRVGVLRLPFHQAFMLPALVVVVLRPVPYFLLESVRCKPREDRYSTLVKCIIPRVAVSHALFCPRVCVLGTQTCVQFCLDKTTFSDHPLPVSVLPQWEEERLKARKKMLAQTWLLLTW